jgi:hypothetical protein
MVLVGVNMLHVVDPGESFAPYAGALRVTRSDMTFGIWEERPVVVIVGKLTNSSDVPWRDVVLEVRFRDPDSGLVDTTLAHTFYRSVQPSGDLAFKASLAAELPLECYAEHEVFVAWAEDARTMW